MKLEGPSTNIAKFPLLGVNAPGAGYDALLSHLDGVPKRPLRLNIDFRQFAELCDDSLLLVELLKREISSWATVLGQRTIGSMLMFHPFEYVAHFEMTRLLHIIASRFHIPEVQQKNFAVISNSKYISSAQIALSKGLGFSNYQIVVDHDERDILSTLISKVGMLRQYNFDSVGLQLQHTDCLDEARESIKTLQTKCEPDYICLGEHGNGFDVIVDNGNEFGEELQKDDVDVLGLGPDGKSQLGDIALQNYTSLEKYQSSLESSQIPVHVHPKQR